ncbi:unnamed protein product [Polarella glacialis]|uniref:Isopenicillin N synthase-like Fe(2+) 2OG dioxygenase domain-containing protein n=1 Tax=Polarella glacialis TaxID=89957 RepID=A0A813HL88_POLGL|nr:unnamed protein product [Polarella glacialis]
MAADTEPIPVHPRKKLRRKPPSPAKLQWSRLVADPSAFADILELYHYVILTEIPSSVTAACDAASKAFAVFFDSSTSVKNECVCRSPGKRCGYRQTSRSEGIADYCQRESYQVRGDSGSAQPWPSYAVAASAARCALQLEDVAQRCLAAALRGAPMPSRLDVEAMTLGPSVLDAFHYLGGPPPGTPDQGGTDGGATGEVLMYEHLDPGFLTLEPRASAAGLEVFEGETEEWRLIEPELGTGDLVVLACEALQRVTAGAIKGSLHRVVSSAERGPRYAIAYELRSLEPSSFAIGDEPLGRS